MDLDRTAELAAAARSIATTDGSWSPLEQRPAARSPADARSRSASWASRQDLRLHDRATRRSSSSRRRRTRRASPALMPARPSAAEAADHVVQDRQPPAQRVDRDPLVDAVEALEEALLGLEPERREAVGRDAERRRCAWRRSRTGP